MINRSEKVPGRCSSPPTDLSPIPTKPRRKLLEIANNVEVVQDGRIYIELINGPFLYREKGTPAEYKAGFDLAIERGLA